MAVISVAETIGKSSAILHSDGLLLYSKMKEFIEDDITLSFEGISHCTTAFLNASIGKYLIENTASKLIHFDLGNEPHIKQKLDLVLDHAMNEKKRTRLNDSARNLFYA